MRSLDRQAQNLERKADATRSEEQKKEYRRQARSRPDQYGADAAR